MLVIELVSKWEICWVLWSLVVFDPNDDLTRNNVAWFLMGYFLRLTVFVVVVFEREKNYTAVRPVLVLFSPDNSEIPVTLWM